MKILDAYDLTGSLRDAAELAGCSHNTVKRYVDSAPLVVWWRSEAAVRPQLIDEFLPKVEEWVERSNGKVRADVAHDKLRRDGLYRLGAHHPPRGRAGEGGVSRRPGAGASALGDRAGDVAAVRLRRRPVGRLGRATVLFCAWLAWSRFRVVLALRDKTMPSVFAALDRDVPSAGRGADVCVDRQREDRHHRAHRRDRGP